MKIYQIYFNEESRNGIEEGAIPYDNSNKEWLYHEHEFFLEQYMDKKEYLTEDYVGSVSWKLRQKTGYSVNNFKQMIYDNPGYDLYNLAPQYAKDQMKQFNNVWIQGEYWHPGIIDFANKLYSFMGYNFQDILNQIHTPENSLWCSYFVGNKNFYEEFIPIMLQFHNVMRYWNMISGDIIKHKDDSRHYTQFKYTYVMERIITSYINSSECKFKTLVL